MEAVATLEDAVHLLRRAPLGTLVWHLAGSAPFALGLLFYWNTVSNPRTSAESTVAQSLALAILLLWMNCCRSIFAQMLRRVGLLACHVGQPSSAAAGLPPGAQSLATLWNLISTQSLLGATKLFAIPLAALTVFPLAAAVAFYRYAAILPIPKARKLASIDTGQNWALLLLIQLLWLLTAVNVAAALAILPQLLRALTGIESGFSRSGVYYMLNPLFFLVVFLVTWMLFDPFVQAVYTVRCFRLESLETGEDVRAGMRRIRRLGGTGLLACALATPTAFAAIPPQTLRESIRQAVRSPEYDWRLPPEPAKAGKPWLVQFTDRLIVRTRFFFNAIGRGIGQALRWLFRKLEGGQQPGTGAPPSGLHWSVYLMTAAVLAISFWLFLRRRRIKPEPSPAEAIAPVALDAEDLSPERLPEEQWLDLAAQCLRQGDYRLALRALYLANLAWLGQREFLTLHSGKTNREYESELRRRGRAFPKARDLFAANVAVFERAWYGARPITSDEVTEFRQRMAGMKEVMAA